MTALANGEYADDTWGMLVLMYKQRMYGKGWFIMAPNMDPEPYISIDAIEAGGDNLKAIQAGEIRVLMQGTRLCSSFDFPSLYRDAHIQKSSAHLPHSAISKCIRWHGD